MPKHGVKYTEKGKTEIWVFNATNGIAAIDKFKSKFPDKKANGSFPVGNKIPVGKFK